VSTLEYLLRQTTKESISDPRNALDIRLTVCYSGARKIEEDMRYKIVDHKGKEVAAFLNKSDRDLCLDHLRETYPDCEFEPKDS